MEVKELLDFINNSKVASSVGTNKEKTIHQFIKYYLNQDTSTHEIKIGKNIVDVYFNDVIYEIQTSNFNLLRNKFDNLLDDYQMCVVFPIYNSTIIYKIDDNGELIKIRKSPKKEMVYSIGDELYKIKPYLKHPHLSFKIFVFDCLEYKKEYINRYRKTRLTSIDRVPCEIINVFDIKNFTDWINFLDIEEEFDRFIFSKKYHLSKKQASSMLNVLKDLGLIEIIRKDKNKYIYKKS